MGGRPNILSDEVVIYSNQNGNPRADLKYYVFSKSFNPSCKALVELYNYQVLINKYFALPLLISLILAVFMTISLIFFGLMLTGGVLGTVSTVSFLVPIVIPLVTVFCQADDIRLQVRV